ncbi:MAG TPA: C25 family cysteine peptidase [Pirellulales bacterium]|nr:C25 family cysteine peptidase [Pirellulales bacterium]
MQLYWLLLTLLATPAQAVDTVLVCPPVFEQAMKPWSDFRRAQGHRLARIDGTQPPDKIRQQIRDLARSGTLRFIVLVGDADQVPHGDRSRQGYSVPTHYVPAKVNVRWGSEPEIATDNWYADFDDDDLPDAAIGRLSADTTSQLSNIVGKIIGYESQVALGGQAAGGPAGDDEWRRRVNLVAGLGGFGAIVDAAIETAAKSIIAEGIPAAYTTSLTHASWRSPYCPPPAQFGETVVGRMNEGCLFWVYMGHGQPSELDRVQVPGGEHSILHVSDVERLQAHRGPPIALFLACYTAAYDARSDCLAEELLRAERGPVAAIGGSRVTMPYAMSVLGVELLKECFVSRRPTVGEMLLYAKRALVLGPRDDARSKQLDALASLLSPSPDELAAERLEHVQLFNLLGDPLLALGHPLPVKVHVADIARPGDRLVVSGECDVDGRATVELVVRRDRLTFKPEARDDYFASSEADDEYQRTYTAANNPRLAIVRMPFSGGKFHTQLLVPEHATGACHVRVFVQGRQRFAAGSADVEINGERMTRRR